MKKYKISYILSTLICTFLLFSCSNLIENLKGKPAPDTVSSNPYLTFKGNGAFELSVNSKNWDGKLDYSTDKKNWTEDWDGITPIPAAASNGSYFVYLRGKGNTSFSAGAYNNTTIGIMGTATAVECNGNIMTLLDWENPDTATMNEYCFCELFKSCQKLTKGPDLPSMNLSTYCYLNMFENCTALVTAPELPATTLADYCYHYMFHQCTSLEASPALPATTVTEACYTLMFAECSSLSSIGKISAKVIDKNFAMQDMFYNCSNIKVVETSNPDEAFLTIESVDGALSVNTMFGNTKAGGVVTPTAGNSYKVETPYLTFKGNNSFSLGINTAKGGTKNWNGTVEYSTDKTNWTVWDGTTSIPSVASNGRYYIYLRGKDNTHFATDNDYPKTILALTGSATSIECSGNIMTLLDWENPDTATMDEYCFCKLFQYCDKLTKAPDLPATSLSNSCYYSMFEKCTSLIATPKLPATTLTDWCYIAMFRDCSALTDVCELPALNLTKGCYDSMFAGCSSLENVPELPATTMKEVCYAYMFEWCTSLKKTPVLPATTLDDYCYYRMFFKCTALETVQKISATNIDKSNAMSEMFRDCSNIKIVEASTPEEGFITTSSITSGAVSNMFSGCSAGSVTEPTEGKSYKVEIPFVASNYLTFKGNDTFILELNTGASKAWDGTVYYSTDKTTWKEWNKTDDSKIASSAVSGGKAYIYLAGKDNSSFVNESFEITNFYLSGNASSVECNGNIMALLDCENPGTVTMGDYCFMYLFMDCDKLTKAPSLPATTLSMGCYGAMFQNCSNLTEAPALSALTLSNSCYSCMFADCTSLTTAPSLPATTLKVNCYAQMFSGCTALETAPVLNALSLAEECYSEMFSGCTSLTSSPALPATVLETQCFESMFSGCTSLRSIGKISATNLDKQRVMFEMFKNCSSIKVVETTVTEEAFLTISSITETQTVSDMFSGCMTGSITQPSEGKSYKYVIE